MTAAVVLALAALVAGTATPTSTRSLRLAVPALRQAPERCGPAALSMVLRFYGADSTALLEAERAYDPVLRGALISDLAAAARRAGFRAEVVAAGEDSLREWLRQGVPPILLFRRGAGPITFGHYGAVIGWDEARRRYALNDGAATTREVGGDSFVRRWRAAGGLALVVRPRGS